MFVSYCVVEERKMVNFNPQTYTQIHIPTMVQWGEGGVVDGTPSRSFLYVSVF